MRLLKTAEPAPKGRDLPQARKRVSAPRRRASRYVLPSRRVLTAGAVALGLAVLGGTGFWLERAGHIDRALAWTGETITNATLAAGFRVEGVFVDGRAETDTGRILRALDLAIGDPILFFDPQAARDRLESLGWVKSARIERRLPNTVIVRLEERRALAIWQRDGAFDLIDADGVVIGRSGLSRYGDLLVVVGEGAEKEAAHLVALLDQEPDLRGRVEAAVRVGERRWNLRFKGGVDVRLPETGLEDAVKRLAALDQEHDLIGADIRLIDMRQPDRMVLRQTPEAAERRRAGPGDRT